MSDAGRQLVDGRGSQRVLDRLEAHSAFDLRPAVEADVRGLWELANEPSVRNMAFSSKPIAWEEHVPWFQRRLQASGTRMWVLSARHQIAGQIRYDVSDDAAVIAISVSPAFRGAGLAALLLARTWESACRELGVATAKGVVFVENRVSAAAFIEAGFERSPKQEMISDRRCWVFRRSVHQ